MGLWHFRFAALYLVLLNVGITLYFRYAIRRAATNVSARPSHWRSVIVSSWAGMMAFYTFLPDVIVLWDFEPWMPLRWSAAAPAVAAILLTAWAMRSQLGLDSAGDFVAEGPYRWCSYPIDAGWVVMFLAGAALGANWVIIATSLVAMLALRTLVPREQEPWRSALLGDAYAEYTHRAGCFLPATATVDQSRYNVPNRFGLTAIMGLLTTLAFIFGVLRHYDSPPVVYMFVVSEIVAICLAQIFFGTAPRGGSALTGAVLLPFWVYISAGTAIDDAFRLVQSMPPLACHALLVFFLAAFGALVGYCTGALAAGFFLLMDMFEPWLTGAARSEGWSPAAGGSKAES